MSEARKYEWVPGALAIATTAMVALAALTPYLWAIPKDNMNLITQSQTTLWNGWLMILGFYFATSLNARKASDTIDTLAQTARTAGAALAPLSPIPDVTLEPGQTATVAATPEA